MEFWTDDRKATPVDESRRRKDDVLVMDGGEAIMVNQPGQFAADVAARYAALVADSNWDAYEATADDVDSDDTGDDCGL